MVQVGRLHLRAERRGPGLGGDHSGADAWLERQERGGEAHLLSAPWKGWMLVVGGFWELVVTWGDLERS